jgi:hypothetical protein
LYRRRLGESIDRAYAGPHRQAAGRGRWGRAVLIKPASP